MVDGLKDLLIPRPKSEIGETRLIPANALDEVVHLEYLHIKVAQSAAGEIKAKEG